MNTPKKVLGLNLWFALPDDFGGDLNDALRELIKYREAKGRKVEQNQAKDDIEISRADLWNGFLQSFEEGYRLKGLISLGDVPNPSNECGDK